MGRDYVDSITCSSCDKPFSSGNLYLSHYQLKHGGFPPEYNDKEKFFCDQCPKIFLEKHRLASHKRSGVILIVELQNLSCSPLSEIHHSHPGTILPCKILFSPRNYTSPQKRKNVKICNSLYWPRNYTSQNGNLDQRTALFSSKL